MSIFIHRYNHNDKFTKFSCLFKMNLKHITLSCVFGMHLFSRVPKFYQFYIGMIGDETGHLLKCV